MKPPQQRINWLTRLPGYIRTPYGFELRLLRLMPHVLVAGTLLPALMAWLARFFVKQGSTAEIERYLQMFDYVMIGLVVSIWTAGLITVFGCVIVWVMKGPAYVADGYNVSHSDQPKV